MLSSVLEDVLLRQVPQHLLSGVQSGELKVFGSVIRSLASGRIEGHLQETSALTKLAANALSSPATVPLQGVGLAADLVGHTATIAQNEQIKAAVGLVQQLQIASLAVGALGIGVSIAGFAIISAKIARVENRLTALGADVERVARKVDVLRQDRIAEDFTRLRTAAEQMDEAWLLSDPAPQWRQVANETHAIANTFERRACELLDEGADLGTVDPFLEALAVAAATRVSARMAAGDDLVGRRAAEEGARALLALGRRVSLGDAALRAMESHAALAGSREWNDKLDSTADSLRPSFAALRQREAAAASTALTTAELEKQGIPGRAWLEAARAEEASPALCLLPLAA